MSVYRRIQIRRGTSSEWTSASPPVVLHQGEVGLDTSAKRIKVGDGFKEWSELEYIDDPGLNIIRSEYGDDTTFQIQFELYK